MSTETRPAPASIDEYIAGFPPETRTFLEEIRALIREEAPEAAETISYAIPTFEVDGRYLVYFAGWKKHVALYPVTAAMVEKLGPELEPYRKGKGTLQLPLSRPLPADLVRRIVAVRRREVGGA